MFACSAIADQRSAGGKNQLSDIIFRQNQTVLIQTNRLNMAKVKMNRESQKFYSRCAICEGDKADFKHYGSRILCCKGCAQFFKRRSKCQSIKALICVENESLCNPGLFPSLNKKAGSKALCPKCRYMRCQQVGMDYGNQRCNSVASGVTWSESEMETDNSNQYGAQSTMNEPGAFNDNLNDFARIEPMQMPHHGMNSGLRSNVSDEGTELRLHQSRNEPQINIINEIIAIADKKHHGFDPKTHFRFEFIVLKTILTKILLHFGLPEQRLLGDWFTLSAAYYIPFIVFHYKKTRKSSSGAGTHFSQLMTSYYGNDTLLDGTIRAFLTHYWNMENQQLAELLECLEHDKEAAIIKIFLILKALSDKYKRTNAHLNAKLSKMWKTMKTTTDAYYSEHCESKKKMIVAVLEQCKNMAKSYFVSRDLTSGYIVKQDPNPRGSDMDGWLHFQGHHAPFM